MLAGARDLFFQENLNKKVAITKLYERTTFLFHVQECLWAYAVHNTMLNETVMMYVLWAATWVRLFADNANWVVPIFIYAAFKKVYFITIIFVLTIAY